MIEYTIIGNFQYKKQEYQALIDDNRRYYFLKINNNQEEYININEYIALINGRKRSKEQKQDISDMFEEYKSLGGDSYIDDLHDIYVDLEKRR